MSVRTVLSSETSFSDPQEVMYFTLISYKCVSSTISTVLDSLAAVNRYITVAKPDKPCWEAAPLKTWQFCGAASHAEKQPPLKRDKSVGQQAMQGDTTRRRKFELVVLAKYLSVWKNSNCRIHPWMVARCPPNFVEIGRGTNFDQNAHAYVWKKSQNSYPVRFRRNLVDTFLPSRDECDSLNFSKRTIGCRDTRVRKSGAGFQNPAPVCITVHLARLPLWEVGFRVRAPSSGVAS